MCSFTGFSSLNGSNLRVYHLTNELLKRGGDLSFVVPGAVAAESCRERFGVPAVDVGIEISRFKSSKFKLYPIFAWKARKKIQKSSELVFGQSLPAALAVKLSKTAGRKAVDYVDLWSEYWHYEHRGLKGDASYRALRFAESYSVKGPDTVFTITSPFRQMIESRGCRPERIKTVRDGVDTKMFRPLKVPGKFMDKYELEKGTDYVTYQGGIGIWDGVQFLADAAPRVLEKFPEAKFLVVGEGPYAPVVREKVRKARLEKNFVFTGWVPYEDMPYFMNVSRVNAVPIPDAPCMRGVLTLKLFEAMACGLPTIINGLPGVREHTEHGKTAYFSDPENSEKFAAGISELLGDAKLRKKISSGGLKSRRKWRT
jgi:glycosyltransferase involved in cell wall biosynthesis